MNAKIDENLVEEAVGLAATWLKRADELMKKEDRRFKGQMVQLLKNKNDKVILTHLIDQSFRSKNHKRVADQVAYILDRYGTPEFFPTVDQFLIHLFRSVGRHVPGISVPVMIEKIRKDSSRSVISGDPEFLYHYLVQRKKEGAYININHIGEAVLGEDEARSRMNNYVKALEETETEHISVKISTIYSQVSSLAFDHTVAVLKERLGTLFRTAQAHFYIRNGKVYPKFVNLDMEEYRDLEITAEAFQQTLDDPEFKNYSAGIALQAYIPESYEIQRELTQWALKRTASGGAPIKIRIVKGANLEMEFLESSHNNWPTATYDNKLDVDANYKRMVTYGIRPDRIRSVHLGIASHNLFELAYAHLLAVRNRVTDCFLFEMLEGMADHIRRAVAEISGDVLLYAPVAPRDQFIHAVAYLIRRLDENTGEENFLRHSFNLTPQSREWDFLKRRFLASVKRMEFLDSHPRRTQDRTREDGETKQGTFHEGEFKNEPNTDWSLPANRKWAEAIRDKWRKQPGDTPIPIPMVVAGEEIFEDREPKTVFDPSTLSRTEGPEYNIVVGHVAQAEAADIDIAVNAAKADPEGWRDLDAVERHRILSRAAENLRRDRGDLIGAAAANTGKIFSESDVEVSEAVDFVEFYSYSARGFQERNNLSCTGKGVGLVISPWNFPIAIPTGGIAAALSAGNTVIFKPASAAAMTAWYICKCFWDAGVSKNTLQFLPCSGETADEFLIPKADIDFIIFTGGTDTGLTIWRNRPAIHLAAETGGKGAMVVTAMADRDEAVKDIVYSAFGNCGQKCSATTLAVLTPELFDDDRFKQQLVDASKSFFTGSAWDFENKMGPLIAPPRGDLKNAMSRLEEGESWALKTRNIDNNPYLWTPAIKWNVQPGSYTHNTEFFGPVLGVMRADDLAQAMELVNATGYGLTSGLQSLDKREQKIWSDGIKAGNLYINRGTTGAIVLRQAFGGMRKSALGAGIKAGGPNYVLQFMDIEEIDFPLPEPVQTEHEILAVANEWQIKVDWNLMGDRTEDIKKAVRAVKSYIHAMDTEFGVERDYFHLRGQDNIFRYRPKKNVLIRLHQDDSLFDIIARIAAVRIIGGPATLSIPADMDGSAIRFLAGPEGRRLLGDINVVRQDDTEVTDTLPKYGMIRYAAPDRTPASVLDAAAGKGIFISRARVFMDGRLELIHYFKEQSLCTNYHRYGNLGERTL